MNAGTGVISNLFNTSGAEFSKCGKYRYQLWRIWDTTKPLVMFIGLNPSTANDTTDDPTIRRVKSLTASWGFGGFYMMNLFPFITPYPEELETADHQLQEYDQLLLQISSRCIKVIFAWGSFKVAQERAETVIRMFPHAECLQINKDGSPKHPLYCKSNTKPLPYRLLYRPAMPSLAHD